MAELCGLEDASTLRWTRADESDVDATPFWYVDLPSEELARAIASRALLVRGIVEEWGSGADEEACARAAAAYDESRKTPYLDESTTFRVEVEDFGCKGGTNDIVRRLDVLNLPFKGRANLKNPEHVFWSVVSDAERSGDMPGVPKRVFFGRLVGRSDRSMLRKYDLKKRTYLGPTSMDAEMALLMANFAHARPGGVILDPFCGTGSMLVAAAHYGAMTMGIDIDCRVIKYGKSAATKSGKFGVKADDAPSVNVWSNFEQYGLPPPLALIHGDLHALPTRKFGLEGMIQGIVADPPYGVRAGGRKSGGRKPVTEDYIIPDELRDGHIPSTSPYLFGEMNDDLMELAARFLPIGGRLTFFLPGVLADTEEEVRELVPSHPALRLRWHSLETFNEAWGRRLVTYEKIAPYDADAAHETRARAAAARASSDKPDLIERMRALVRSSDAGERKRRQRYERRFGKPPPDASETES